MGLIVLMMELRQPCVSLLPAGMSPEVGGRAEVPGTDPRRIDASDGLRSCTWNGGEGKFQSQEIHVHFPGGDSDILHPSASLLLKTQGR